MFISRLKEYIKKNRAENSNSFFLNNEVDNPFNNSKIKREITFVTTK